MLANNRPACEFQESLGVVRYSGMKLLRWNKGQNQGQN
jgi:hypothetical protein